MAKTIDLIKKYEASEQVFKASTEYAQSAAAARAAEAYKAAYESKIKATSVDNDSAPSQNSGANSQKIGAKSQATHQEKSLDSLLKEYLKLAQTGELSASMRGELSATLKPMIDKFYDDSYSKISHKLYKGVKASAKQEFSQAKLLSELGTLDHGGRCLPLAKAFLAAASQGRADELLGALSAASANSENAKALAGLLHEMHASGTHQSVAASLAGVDEVIRLLDAGETSLLLNTATHSMAAAKRGEKYMFFDPNAVLAEFNSADKFAKAINKYLGGEYGELLGLSKKPVFTEIVRLDADALSLKLASLPSADGESLPVSLSNLLSGDMIGSAKASAEYAAAIKKLPAHAFLNTNNNANTDGASAEVDMLSVIKTALANEPDGGYWVADIDGASVLLSDAEIGENLSKFSSFISQNRPDGDEYIYVLKTKGEVKLISFSADDSDMPGASINAADSSNVNQNPAVYDGELSIRSASISSDDDAPRASVSSISSEASDEDVVLKLFDDGVFYTVEKDDDGVSLATQLANYKIADIGSNLISFIRYVGAAASTDVSTKEGQASVASSSLSAIGSASDIATIGASLAGASGNGVIALGSVSGVLSGVSNLINIGLIAANFKNLSHKEQVAAGIELGLKTAGSLGIASSSIAGAALAAKGVASSIPGLGAAAAAISLAISPLAIAGLVEQGKQVGDLSIFGEEMKKAGYAGDALLAELLKDKLTSDAASTAAGLAFGIGMASFQAAAAASVVGAPAAAIAGVVGGLVLGIMEASKQPALEAIAAKYRAQLEELGGADKVFADGLKANYSIELAQRLDDLAALKEAYSADVVIDVAGVKASQSMLELAAITKTTEQIKTAANFASAIGAGILEQKDKFNIDEKTGALSVNSAKGESALIAFSTPLFAPGSESATRTKVGKNSFYTKLAINAPDKYSVNGGAGDDTFVLGDNYASVLLNKAGKVVKKLSLLISGGDGDDTFVADGGFSEIDGGSGNNAALYSAKNIAGITLRPLNEAHSFTVSKMIEGGAVVSEGISTHSTSYGKRAETVEYRDLSIKQSSYTAQDILKNIQSVAGSEHADDMLGGVGDDVLLGLGGDDHINGGAGDDIILGGAGNDVLAGGDGDDTLLGGAGSNYLYGGAGNDTYIVKSGETNIVVDTDGENSIIIDSNAKFSFKNLGANKIKISFENGGYTLANADVSVYAMGANMTQYLIEKEGSYVLKNGSILENEESEISLAGLSQNSQNESIVA